MVLNILGGGGSGKSTLKFALVETGKFRSVVSYTTRPMRKDEVNGLHYHFISHEQFLKQKFLISKIVNEWHYGVKKDDLIGINCSKIAITTFDVNGVNLLVSMGINVRVVLLDIAIDVRKERMIMRGDNERDVETRLLIDRNGLKKDFLHAPVLIVRDGAIKDVIINVKTFVGIS